MQTFTLVEILRESRKINTVNDLLSNFNAITELAKEDVKKISMAKKIFFADFDATFSMSQKMLNKTLRKKHLKAVKRFLNCENIDDAVNFIIQRLLNNMKNITTNQNYNEYAAPPKFSILHDNIKVYDSELERALQLSDLKKISAEKLKQNLKKIWEEAILDFDFDLIDFENLCTSYGFRLEDVLDYNPYATPEMKGELTECGNTQLVLIF